MLCSSRNPSAGLRSTFEAHRSYSVSFLGFQHAFFLASCLPPAPTRHAFPPWSLCLSSSSTMEPSHPLPSFPWLVTAHCQPSTHQAIRRNPLQSRHTLGSLVTRCGKSPRKCKYVTDAYNTDSPWGVGSLRCKSGQPHAFNSMVLNKLCVWPGVKSWQVPFI